MQKINELQELLSNENIQAYIIPTSDFHLSEYISDHFKAREFFSGFTGSAGTLVVTKKEARLWTDGRYFIQAEKELPKEITLMRQGNPGVDTIIEYLIKILSKDDTIGFDSRIIDANFAIELQNKLPSINIKNIDLITPIWKDRPNLPFSNLYIIDEYFSGESSINKINKLRKELEKENATMHILTSLEDQAWLYNLRGNDILNTPVFLSFSIITNKQINLFIDKNKIDSNVKDYLSSIKVKIHSYNDIYSFLEKIKDETILVDKNTINYNIYSSITNNTLIFKENPSLLLKSIKNDIEISHTKNAHIKDGIAMVKAICWLKTNIDKIDITEISFSKYLYERRKEQQGFIEESFDTIAAFKDHGAMMHYSATSESDIKLTNSGDFFLVDSGGHYIEGTTDITRTFALGDISDEMKLHFTTTLKSMINLTKVTFMEGCRGVNLDILARGPIWNLMLDYKCGTGHGVGHILSVHEGPNGFRWKIVPERNDSAILYPGMITTNEPGIYLEGKYGIRIENELLCVNKGENEWGKFLSFETITVCPIDLNAIEPSLLNNEEKDWLNNYHKFVYETLSPYLSDKEKKWLKENTKSI